MGIILVYDCTEEQTFNNISNWLKQIDQHASSNVAKVLVANKCDKPDKVIESERGKALADQHGLAFFECSAKTGFNVQEIFNHIAKIIIKDKLPLTSVTANGNGTAANGRINQAPQSIQMNPNNQRDKVNNDGGCCK